MSTTDGRWLLLVAQSFRGFGTGTRGGGDRGRCGALCGRHCSASIDPTMLAASFAMPPGWLGSECSGVRRAGTDQAPAASSRRSAHLVRSAAQDAIPLPATASLGARGCTAKDGQERLRRGGDAIEPRGQPRGHGRARGAPRVAAQWCDASVLAATRGSGTGASGEQAVVDGKRCFSIEHGGLLQRGKAETDNSHTRTRWCASCDDCSRCSTQRG